MEDRKVEAVKEKIRFYTELLKLLFALELGVGGGIVGLSFKLPSAKAIFFISLGLVLESIAIAGSLILFKSVQRLLKELEK